MCILICILMNNQIFKMLYIIITPSTQHFDFMSVNLWIEASNQISATPIFTKNRTIICNY